MRAFALICALVVAACDDAVVIEVSLAEDVPAESVQLYIGLVKCDGCDGVRPPFTQPASGTNGEHLPGDVYYREDSGRTTIVREAKVEGGVAKFRIEASELGDRIETAVAVDANNRSAFLIPALAVDEARVYKVKLVAAQPTIGPKGATASGTFVSVWRQATAMTPCMAFERWHDGSLLGSRVFIVPEDDPDCDEIKANDCNELAYKSIGVPAIEDATCTVGTNAGDAEGTCKLAGPTCDDAGGMHACAPTDYCLPSQYCDPLNALCANSASRDSIQECLFRTVPTARLRCSVPMKPKSTTRYEPCGAVPFEIPAATAGTTFRCLGPSGNLMLGPPRDGEMLAFSEGALVVTGDVSSTATLDVHAHHDSECKYKIDFGDGDVTEAAVVGGKQLPAGFAQIWLQRSGGFVRKLLVPVVIQVKADPTCGLEPACELEVPAADALASCVR